MKSLIGHKILQDDLQQLFKSGNMPHALLLSGRKGIGKSLLAKHFACRVICGADESSMFEAEGLSFNQNHHLYPQIEAGACPDLLEVNIADDKKAITVGQIRQMLTKLSLSSDGKRVVIVNDADTMNNAAANALLKTLEEPGQGVHIVLVVHNVSRVLPTIISRCRHFKVGPLTDDQVDQALQNELPSLSAVQRDELVEIAKGSVGDAMRLMENGAEVLGMLDGFFKNPSQLEAINLAEKLQGKKLAPLGVELLLSHISIRAKNNPNDAVKWATLYQKVDKKRADMEIFNLSPQLVLETSLMDVIS